MGSTTLYPGKGLQLGLAGSNPQEPVWTAMRTKDFVIPDGESSLGIAVNPGFNVELNVLFDAAPSGTAFNVMYDISPDFANEYVLEAVAASADTLYTFTTVDFTQLSGFIRLTNDGGQDCQAWIQQKVWN